MKEPSVGDIMKMIDGLLYTKENEAQFLYEKITNLLVAIDETLGGLKISECDPKIYKDLERMAYQVKKELYTFDNDKSDVTGEAR